MEAYKKQLMEKECIAYMIQYYCKKKHRQKHLCTECKQLLDYANKRIDQCPFMESKTFCSACKIHCYQSEQRAKIREVMRYVGPRMLFHRPILAIRHLMIERKEKTRL